MDATREHLWGQLLLERNLVARDDLIRIAQERDAIVRGGQETTLAQMLVQQRRLDPHSYASLNQEVEGRGRACPQCRRVFFAPRSDDPPRCPACGGPSGLRPVNGWAPGGTGQFRVPAGLVPGESTGQFAAPGGTGQFRVPAGLTPPPSGRYAGVPGPGSGHYPNGAAGYPAPATGSYAAVAPTASYAGRAPAAPNGSSWGPPPSTGQYAAVGPAASYGGRATGTFQAPAGAEFDPMGGASAPGPLPSTPAGEALDDSASTGELGVGKRFGKYEIASELGRGGMGVVYKARAAGQQSYLALKVLLAGEFASPKLMERFRDEAKLAKRLRHPNIVAVHDAGDVDGIPFYAMDYIEGSELQELIRQKNLPTRRGVEILVEVCRAAHYAHENGVVHRDLKPANILVSGSGQSYIMDFGLAKDLDDDKRLTKSGVAIGTPYYMPPEQARGMHREMDARSDVYALGAILYEIITRRVPFSAKTQNELLRKIVEEEPQAPRVVKPGTPVELDTITLKALRKEKKDRYESALAMAEDLERWLRGEKIAARPEAVWAPWLRKARRNRTLTLAVGGAAVVVVLSVVLIAAIVSKHNAEAAETEKQRIAADLKRKEDEAKRLAEQKALDDKRAVETKKRGDANNAVRAGLEAFLAAKTATSPPEALSALQRAETELGRALGLERELGETRQSTAYRRGLVRRALCRWDAARDDLLAAAKDPAFQARANLALGLLRLRHDADVPGAEQALRQAVAAARVQDETHTAEAREEESTAEAIARAYLVYLQGDEPTARRRLGDLVNGATGGAMVAEAHAALAFIARRDGAALGGDAHVDRGLSKADQAVRADGYRYDVLCDRAFLRARANRIEDATQDLNTARALWGDGELPELAMATVHAKRGDEAKMRASLSGAKSRVAGRPPRVVDEVTAFAERLERAARTQPPPGPGPGPGPRPPQTETGPPRQRQRITGTSSGTVTLTQQATPDKQPLEAEIEVQDDVEAVRVTLRGGWTDIDMLVDGPGGRWEGKGDGADETILLRRTAAAGAPALRPGIYLARIFQPQALGRPHQATLAVRYFKRGEPLPFQWVSQGDLPTMDLNPFVANKTLVETALEAEKRGDFETAIRSWRQLEERHPEHKLLPLFRAKFTLQARRPDEALKTIEGLDASVRNDVRVLNLRCVCLSHLDKYADLLTWAKKLIEVEPKFLDAHAITVQTLLELKRYPEAEKAADEVLKLDPTQDRVRLQRLVAQLAQKKGDAAQQLEALVLAPETGMEGRLMGLRGLAQFGQAKMALEALERLERAAPMPFLVLDLTKAKVLAHNGRKAEGIELLRAIRAKVADKPQLMAVIDEHIREVEAIKP